VGAVNVLVVEGVMVGVGARVGARVAVGVGVGVSVGPDIRPGPQAPRRMDKSMIARDERVLCILILIGSTENSVWRIS
jgi:hypothetical protein